MEELLTYLNAIHSLPVPLNERLRKIIKFRKLFRRKYLLEAGQISREICFVRSGLLRCFYLKDGKDVTSWFMKEGDVIVSIESFYDQVKSYEYIQAVEDCELFFISYHELEALYHEFPEFNFIGRVLTVKYLKLWTRQLFNMRMMTAKERYEYIIENNPDLVQRVSGKYLATYLGMDVSTLYKLKEGW